MKYLTHFDLAATRHFYWGPARDSRRRLQELALARRPESLTSGLVLNPGFDRSPAPLPLDRETLLARSHGIRQFARGGRRGPAQAIAAPLRPRSPEARPADRDQGQH